ncbi:hypothetical protein JMJ58_05395 [Haloterrigena salifodinae]|uniref:Uncharacterized protein n=1 Tax=Haloterrigena salifodinae TaxID=2675099 RepID=A0A8T8E413_9EURY|nr:hypothetical protein [Haloterrigena salifodinae]QRV16327.1 hypothetical protein JMJ58_05395 [Haloterrigena salifodinae]
MDSPEESLEERTRRVRAVLAAVADDPALDEDLRPGVKDAVERLDTALDDGIEDPIPDELFDADPIDPPETEGPRPLDELFDD